MMQKNIAFFAEKSKKPDVFSHPEREGGRRVASVELQVKVTGIDEAIEKARRLQELIKEAKSLADELASMKIELNLDR